MTAQPPPLDPTSTALTPDQAFLHPLPQIRQFHRQLTTQLDDKNARLRTLVGGSYRELLGTAELILQMRKEIAEVEERLGKVGVKCGREEVGRGGRGLRKLVGENEGGDDGRRRELEWSARLKGLNSCGLVVGRLLKKAAATGAEGSEGRGGSLVLAAKVLVLSRLLAKSVGDLATGRSEQDKEVVEELKKKLGKLRRKLLRGVERTLQKAGKRGDNRDDIVQALAAYSLATSSGAKDVLRHFLHVRGEAIALAFHDDENQQKQIPGASKALELYTATLLDVQALVPRRLPEALAALKTKALLKDDAVRLLEELRLDVCEKWFGDEILYFTPYIRHDDLDGPQAVGTLKGWSKRALEVLLLGLTQALESTTDFKSVVELRTKILEIWIKEGGKAKGFDHSILLGGIRKVFNNRMEELLETRISKLHLVGTEIQATLGSWQSGVTDKYESLWDESMLDLEISNGAGLFKQGILSRTHGRNDAVQRVFNAYQTWRHLVDEITAVLEQLKKQRWDDDLEDIEDDLALESRNTLLSREDPQVLQDHLDSSLERSYRELHEKIGALLTTYKEDDHIGQISIYVLRIIRDIRTELPRNPSLRLFGISLVPTLHQQLAVTVSYEPIQTFVKSFSRKQVSGRALWEGSPELPVQPAPATFKLLRNLSLEMGNAGSDLWSVNAVKVLKDSLRLELAKHWHVYLDVKEEDKVNGKTVNGEAAEESVDGAGVTEGLEKTRRELFTQYLFDLFVLQRFLVSVSSKDDDELEIVKKAIEGKIELEANLRKRLLNGAKEYWKRTSLLFGLLV